MARQAAWLARAGSPGLRGTGRELHVLERALPAAPAAVRLARMTARVACRAWRVPDAADDGVLLASELVTAAVQSTVAPQVVLRVLMTPRRLRLEAHDPSGRLNAEDDTLWLDVVRPLARRCGVAPSGPGTQAWAELPLEART